jgi:hypothetical protein
VTACAEDALGFTAVYPLPRVCDRPEVLGGRDPCPFSGVFGLQGVSGLWGGCPNKYVLTPRPLNGREYRGHNAFLSCFPGCVCGHVRLPCLRSVHLGSSRLMTRGTRARDIGNGCPSVFVSVSVFRVCACVFLGVCSLTRAPFLPLVLSGPAWARPCTVLLGNVC